MRALGAGALAIALTFGADQGAEATLEASAAAIENAAAQPDGTRVVIGHLSATRTFDEPVAEHQGGKTWNEVAESHHVAASELLQYVRDSEDAVEQRSEDKGPSKTGSASSHSPGGAGGGSGGGGHRRY